MGLKKANAELLMVKGIEQKVSDYVIPDESLARAENVDFSKVGAAKKRSGSVLNSNLVLNAGQLDEVRRLGARQRREVLCITETVTQIGSAAGIGYAGDTIFSYSEETERWIARGKMPRPNVDVLWTSSAPARSSQPNDFVVGGIDNYVCIAYQVPESSSTRVVVFDVGGDVNASLREAPTLVIDTTFSRASIDGAVQHLAGWAQAGGKVWLFFGIAVQSVGIVDYAAARAFDPATVAFDGADTILDTDHPVHAVSSDGTNIFAVFRFGTGGYLIRKYDENLAEQATVSSNTLVLNNQEIAIDARLGWCDIVRRNIATGNVYVSRYGKGALGLVIANALITPSPGSVGSFGNIQIVTVSETDAVVLWGNSNTTSISTKPVYLSCGLVRMPSGALQGYFNHMGIMPYAQPFIIDGRVYFVGFHTSGHVNWGDSTDPSGTLPGEESFLCFQIPIDNMNAYNVPFPAAQWDYGQCVVKMWFGDTGNGTPWLNGRTLYQSGNGVYLLTSGIAVAGRKLIEWLPTPRLVRLEFGDPAHRWRHEEFHDVAAFAGGVPFVYDGTRTYELSTALHCPTILDWRGYAGGTLVDGKTYFFRAAMLYVDGNGRECWSQPSRIVEQLITAPDQTARITVMPVTTTMKPDMGNFFLGRMKLYLFMATQEAPNEYIVCTPPRDINPFEVDEHLFFVTEPTTADNTQMYTSGFELDNYPAPPCRAMAVHSGRLFMIASDSNEVVYTKPFNRGRGAEVGLGQAIPLPDKGTALASLNDRLAIFTHRSILAIGGDGPDVTGTPPDAFSRPILISPDYGCIEYCAVGRTPLGVIFRGQQGFYLLGMGFDVQYIGAPVEDITAGWESTRSIVHDQKSGCCRIVGYTGERTEELCYWYDTKRWSLNLRAVDTVDMLALGDNLLVGVSDTTVAVASRYRLGSRAGEIEYQDHGESYDQVLETGWLSFQQAGVFKRVWRVYALVRAAGVDARVRIQVWKDWEDRVSSDREFELVSQDTEPRNLRIHLKHQKIKALKVRVTATSDGPGIDLMKIGFELGMRTGGPKEVRESTQ